MNIFLGIIRFDGQLIDSGKLKQAAFLSPQWIPDHQGCFIDGAVGIVNTQRFITDECSHGLLPMQHELSNCVIVADAYLAEREILCAALSQPLHLSSAELILYSYLKWGQDCTQHLRGAFSFAIWDKNKRRLFLAIDQFGQHPCLYAYQPGKYFIFANEMSGFRVFLSQLTLNEDMFAL